MAKRAQSGIEYGAFFAFSLMLGLIIITLIGKFPSFGLEGRIEESKNYWYGKKPISIENSVYYSNGNLTLVVRNRAVPRIEVLNISTSNGTVVFNKNVSSGKTAIASATGFPTCNASNLEAVTLEDVVIHYRYSDSSSPDEVLSISGTVPLRNYCIPAPASSSKGGGGGGGGCAGPTIIFTLIFLYDLLGPKF